MTENRRERWPRGSAYLYTLLSVGAVIAAALVPTTTDDSPFDQFFGGLPAPAAIAVTAAVGALSLHLLAARDWFVGLTPGWRPFIAALGFAVVAVTVDLLVPFPEDTNVEWPTSLLFYPAIGFLAEILFHVVPVAVVLLVTGWHFGSIPIDRRVSTIIVAIAAGEAAFQVAGALTDGSDARLVPFVAVHLFAIGAVELAMFRLHGFGSIMTFRLAYYLLWHVVWGHLRLFVLF